MSFQHRNDFIPIFFSGDKTDKASTSTGGGSGQPLVQIGHYKLGETLGIGTFGKVKGKSKYILYQGFSTAWFTNIRLYILKQKLEKNTEYKAWVTLM